MIREALQGREVHTSLVMHAMTLTPLSASLLEGMLCHVEEASPACMDIACLFPLSSGL